MRNITKVKNGRLLMSRSNHTPRLAPRAVPACAKVAVRVANAGKAGEVRRLTIGRTAARIAIVFAGVACAQTSYAETVALKDCLQDDSARLALRACSALLQGSELSTEDKLKAYASRGRAWLREEEPQEAIADFTRVLDASPGDAEILRMRARAHAQLDDHKAAAADWSAIVAGDPDADAPVLARASSWLAAGDAAAALADYDLVLARNAKSIEARIGRGNVFAAQDRKEEAYHEFDLAQAIDPAGWQVYHARGVAADKWGDTKIAIDNYSQTLRLNTVNWDARRALRRLGIINVP